MSHAVSHRRSRALASGAVMALTLGLSAGVMSPAPASAIVPSPVKTYTNDTAIVIPDFDIDPVSSVITVPPSSGVESIGNFSVTLLGLTHTFVDDLYVNLVSPENTLVELLCQQQVAGSSSPSDEDVTFSSDGLGQANCTELSPDRQTHLDDFSHENPTGDWTLKVADQAPGDTGSIARGFSISFEQGDPLVTQQPEDSLVQVGDVATFTAHSAGTPTPTVQWQVSTDDGVTWSDVAGATDDTLTIVDATLSENRNLYRAAFTNDWTGPSAPVTSGSAQLMVGTVTPAPPAPPAPPAAPPAAPAPPAVPAPPAHATPTLKLDHTLVTSGQRVSVGGTGQPGEKVTLERSIAGSSYAAATTYTVDSAGHFTGAVTAVNTGTYRVRGATGLVSSVATVVAKSKMSMAATRVAKRKYTLHGTVSPARALQVVKVYYKKSNGSYGLLGSVRTSAKGAWSFTHKYSATKRFAFKAVASATDRNASSHRTLSVSVH